MPSSASSLPITVDDLARELRSGDDATITAAASALGALAMRVRLPSAFADAMDDLIHALRDRSRTMRCHAATLAAMSALCATVDDARARALALDGVGACATIAIDGDGEADGADVARVNALDFFRFVQREGDRRGFDAVVGDGRCVPFAMACARAVGGSAMDFMTRVGGADLVVNLARGCAEDDDAFDDLIRAGAFEVFIDATLAEEDEVTVRGLVGLACATPRRRALRARLAERGDAVRRLAALMGASADEEIKGFSGGLFRALALDPETKGLVERALRDGANLAVA